MPRQSTPTWVPLALLKTFSSARPSLVEAPEVKRQLMS